jgi:hypothetical protein
MLTQSRATVENYDSSTDFFPDMTRKRMPLFKRLLIALTISSGALVATGSIALAAEGDFDAEGAITSLATATNLLWVIIGASLVIFMQAGFALVETGFCRAKHAAHVMTTNFAIFGLGFIGFFFVGFPLAFGGFSYGAFGLDAPIGGPLLGSGEWVFLFKGGWALSGGGITPALLRAMPANAAVFLSVSASSSRCRRLWQQVRAA